MSSPFTVVEFAPVMTNSDAYAELENLSSDNTKEIEHIDDKQKHVTLPSELALQTGAMVSSICSSLADTPGDSGVLCLDSETSELTGELPSGMTLSMVEADDLVCDLPHHNDLYQTNYITNGEPSIMTRSDIENQNITEYFDYSNTKKVNNQDLPDLLAHEKENISPSKQSKNSPMKSASDEIVFRRKCKKKNGQSQPKKRVSFHEDILNNTKTDNIHIEHGFVSYRLEDSMNYFKKQSVSNSRYSWCATSDNAYQDRSVDSYRNIRSDVITYGRTEVSGQLDDSGIYEYNNYNQPRNSNKICGSDSCINKLKSKSKSVDSPSSSGDLYICSSSSSDSNLSTESESSSSQAHSLNSDENYDHQNKSETTQKSYSCDCIENNSIHPIIKTMYFSDADINKNSEFNQGDNLKMKELTPKTGCIKKSSLKKKRYISTDVIEEPNTKSKNELASSVKNLLDSNNLFGSLKNIYKNINFGLSIAERGVPEGSEDKTVMEVIPNEVNDSALSKSLDTMCYERFDTDSIRVRGDGFSRKYTHQVDDQLRRKRHAGINEPKSPESFDANNASPAKLAIEASKPNLTLNMKGDKGKMFVDWTCQSANSQCSLQDPQRNKFIVNCESIVYEHKGVSYTYENDIFQTTFDTNKETFTPISDTKSAPQQSKSSPVHKPSIAQKDEDSKASSIGDFTSDSESFSSEKVKLKLTKYLLEQNDPSKGVSKHLSSPLKQRNVMRYEKVNTNKTLTVENNRDQDLCDTASNNDTINDAGEIDETLEIVEIPEVAQKITNRKTSLISRFLRNVCQKKALDAKLLTNKFYQKKLIDETTKFPKIYFPIKGKLPASVTAASKCIDSMINKEVKENRRVSVKLMTADEPSYFDSFEENVAIECSEKMKLELFKDPTEVLHRMLKVRSSYANENGQWIPLLVFITDQALYVATAETGKYEYSLICYLTHDLLDTIIIGPDSQYVKVFDKFGDCRCVLITGDRYLSHRLISSLEWCSRNSRVVVGSIPSIIWKNKESLKNQLINITSIDKDESCVFYGMVGNSAPVTCNGGRPASPFGPPMEGFLMYKIDKQKYWRPSFFLLKSGVLSYGSSAPPIEALSASCLPHNIQLDRVLGVRRCTDAQGRPHCFEIALENSFSLKMAAPDDDTASQWLQGLLMHAAQALEGPKTEVDKKCLPPCCTLLATTEHIVTLREPLMPPKFLDSEGTLIDPDILISDDDDAITTQGKFEILSCASIRDLTAFKIPDNDDNWCILEFIFCEVREGTEMGFLFTSSAELERFISVVEQLWHLANEGVFPMSVVQKSDITNLKCSDWHSRLITAWDKILPAPQR